MTLRILYICIILSCIGACKNDDGQEKAKQNLKQQTAQLDRKAKSNASASSDFQFWDNRTIRFIDKVGGSGGAVYEAIKGQRYFTDTKLFIYATDVHMEGTFEYKKIVNTFEHTALADRIFIWVHFDENMDVIFVKKLVSDNIKHMLDSGTLIL